MALMHQATTKRVNPVREPYIHKSASISKCGTYRYRLMRKWGNGPLVCWVGLNPSTADAEQDDPTIRRVVGLSKREGFAGCIMVNLFAYRVTDPKDLLKDDSAIGEYNDYWLSVSGIECEAVVAAWGAVNYPNRIKTALREFENIHKDLRCFGLTKDGSPRHPLYLPSIAPMLYYRIWI